MVRLFKALIFLFPVALFAADSVYVITAEEWARPRHGETVVEIPGLADAVRAYLRRENQRILIRHPESEEGVLWAEELRSWLVALGISSTDIELSAGGTRLDAIELALKAPGRP